MKRIKRFLSFILVMIFIMTCGQQYVFADETTDYEIIKLNISDGENINTYEALAVDSDLYFSANQFSEITSYVFSEGNGNLGYQLGEKIIIINSKTGDMSIPLFNYSGNIGRILTVDGVNYISMSKLLPWLNVACGVTDSGILEVIPDGISIWEILNNISYDDLMFSLYEEYGDSIMSYASLTAMTMFDTIINLRWDRLIPADGSFTGAFDQNSYYDYKCYISALSDMAVDETMFTEEVANKMDTLVTVNKGLDDLEDYIDADTNGFYEISESWEKLRKSVSSYEQISKYLDVFSVLKSYELIIKADNEYREYLNWLQKQGTDNVLFDKAAKETTKILDENMGAIYSTYTDFGKSVLSVIPGEVFNAIVNNSLDDKLIGLHNSISKFYSGFFGSLETYMLASKLVYSGIFNVTDGYEAMAKVGVNQTIGTFCWDFGRNLQNEPMTVSNVMHMRQSFIIALKASKMCYEGMQETMDSNLVKWLSGTDNSELMNYKIDPINDAILAFIASADASENDSIDNKELYEQELLELFQSVAISKDDNSAKLRIEWDGQYDSGALFNLAVHMAGTMDDGTSVKLDKSNTKVYASDGSLVADYLENLTADKGLIEINIYNIKGYFSLWADDGDFDPSSWSNQISLANATATIELPNDDCAVLWSEDGLVRSYTGVWFWGICDLDCGELKNYDTSWIQEGYDNMSEEDKDLNYKTIYADAMADAAIYHSQYGELGDPYMIREYTLCDVTGDGILDLFVHVHYNKHGADMLIYSYAGDHVERIGNIPVDINRNYVVNSYENGFIHEEGYKGSYNLKYYKWDGTTFIENLIYSTDDLDWTNGEDPEVSMEDIFESYKIVKSLPMVDINDDSVFLKAK